MFTYQGTDMLLVTRDNKSVQVFECGTGRFVHEFKFFNTVLAQLKQQNRRVMQEIEDKKKARQAQKDAQKLLGDNPGRDRGAELLVSEPLTDLSAMQDKETELQKRKALRDKGISECPIPEYRIYKPGKEREVKASGDLSS